MIEWIYRKSGHHFITAMMVFTRLIGSIGGGFVVFYVLLSMHMESDVSARFVSNAVWMILFAVSMTIPIAWTHTRSLRKALRIPFDKQVPRDLADRALLEAIRFPLRQNVLEAIFVPAVTALPMCVDLYRTFGVDSAFMLQIVVTTYLAVGLVLFITFFGSEQWMGTVIADLMQRGGGINFDDLPHNSLKKRMMLCFGLIILLTSVLIGALINQQTLNLSVEAPIDSSTLKYLFQSAVDQIRTRTTFLTIGAIIVGCAYSHWLSQSITGRTGNLVDIMHKVQAGDLSVRAIPTGNDELDVLARRFNDMISELDRRTSEVRHLNANLEHQVETRTEELSASLKKLQVLDQMKTEFFSNVSHELRTPLMLILSPIRQLKTELDDFLDPRSSSLLDVAEVNGQRLLKQINQLLEFSKVQAGRTKIVESAVDLNEIARRLAYAASPFAEQRGLTLQVDLDPDLPATTSDEDKLDIVLTNLVSNAIKFTPSGGTVRIVSKLIFDEHANRRLRLAVEDTGHGIAEEDFPRLFQRFVQLDGSLSREHAGTGLGLALVRELIELLGGQVGVESQIDQGSVFFFELPWKQLQPESVTLEPPSGVIRQESFSELRTCHIEASTEPRPAAPSFAPQVLIVEDNTEMQDLLVDLLSHEYNVTVAENGLHALTLLERSTPDLILSDVMMPYIDGQELCRRVKQRKETANVPFILLTARSKTTMKIEGLDCGAEDYVCKPFEEAELLARVRALLRVRRANVQLDQRNVELERINKELKQTQQQLVQAEKLSSLGQLVAGLAHEINNSINAVYNGVPALKLRLQKLRKMLSTQTGSEPARIAPDVAAHFEKMDTLYEVILDGAERTARIVSDMKTFAHPGRERNEDFDLHRALDLCLNLSVKQSSGKVEIIREYGDVPVIHGPFGQLHQVFLNLLTNSSQAMPDGGQVYVQTVRDDDWFIVHIRDTGTGIPERIRHRIFEPFFTTKAPGVGTGLGLSISYSIVTKLGGKIECHSEMGVGTEFVISIPMVVGAIAGEPPERQLALR